MYIVAESLDDLLRKSFRALLKRGQLTSPTKGSAVEIQGVSLRLKSPLARLSRTDSRGILFSCLGEWLWYMSGSNGLPFIQYYIRDYDKFSDDGKTIHGGYGPRILGPTPNDQLDRVIELLRRKTDTRRAVIQVYDKADLLQDYEDIPCTCTLQFLVRNNELTLHASMRSNDAYVGLPHDVFAFTMLQEYVAKRLGVQLGDYRHYAASFHLYSKDREKAQRFIDEGIQDFVQMPSMPDRDIEASLRGLLNLESNFRTGDFLDVEALPLEPYWKDLARILEIYALSKANMNLKVNPIYRRMNFPVYRMYIRKRIPQAGHRPQGDLFTNKH